MVTEKRLLDMAELEAESALELPERETPLVTVVIGCVVCVGGDVIEIDVRNVGIATAVCAQVNAINVLVGQQAFTCQVQATA